MPEAIRVEARIEAVTPLGAGVREIRLRAASAHDFLPGQYLEILHPDGAPIAFSIASAPNELPHLTLHYLAQLDSEDATRMEALLVTGTTLQLLLPHGACGFTAPLKHPLLALAGGSGVAQVRSILRARLPAPVPVRLYWGAATRDDLYLAAELDELAAQHAEFTWIAVAEESDLEQSDLEQSNLEQSNLEQSNLEKAASFDPAAGTGATATMRRGRVADAVAADIAAGELELEAWQVLVAGGPPMVWGTVKALRPLGLCAEQTLSDVFSYAPRDDLW